MTLFEQKKELQAKRKKTAEEANAILEKAAKEGRKFTPEEDEQFDKRMADVDNWKGLIEKIDRQIDVQQSLSEPEVDQRQAGREDFDPAAGLDPLGSMVESMPAEKRKLCHELHQLELRNYLMFGDEGAGMRGPLKARREALVKQVGAEYRALSAVTANLGETTIPTGFVYNLETALKYYGGIVDVADYIDTSMGNPLPWPSINDTGNVAEVITENTGVGGSGDGGAASENDPVYGVTNFSAYMMDSGFVLVPFQLMQDSAFDIDAYLTEQLQIRIGRKLNTLCTVGLGSGSSQPYGFLNAATLGATTSTPAAVAYNDLLDLFHSVDPAYRMTKDVGWQFADATLLAIRKLTDSNNRPLFVAGGVSEGIQNDAPDTILGKKYYINQDVPTMTNSAKFAAFGPWKKYKIRRVRQIEILRLKERFADKLQLGFLAYQRFDGNLVDAGTHPIRYLQNSAS